MKNYYHGCETKFGTCQRIRAVVEAVYLKIWCLGVNIGLPKSIHSFISVFRYAVRVSKHVIPLRRRGLVKE